MVPHVMQGLPKPAGAEAYTPASVVEFVRVFRFSSATDEEGKHGTGYSPLLLAAASGNVPVVRELLELHKANLHVATKAVGTTIGFMDKGSTPLHAAMACCPPEHCDEMVATLLSGRADPNRRSHLGLTPLHIGAAGQNLACVRALLRYAKDTLLLNAGHHVESAVLMAPQLTIPSPPGADSSRAPGCATHSARASEPPSAQREPAVRP